uniref:Glutamyl-tRNA(Gln) amidotransferase subunit B, chloroplastic/mitochondrial n=2 Tax=Micromonas pusilla TaxID=38833 RepID=A0A7S0GZP2_MICPS|mmetsp:Transcript_6860/g.29218  ORF Transcript_6860/g.29218 Transcript_6860/m.29218 type:complete len:715 (+) Transcript_6860:294-2438(+)
MRTRRGRPPSGMSRRGWRAAASLLRHASASAVDAAPGARRAARRVPTRRVPEAVGASVTDARATAAFPRSIRRWVAAPDNARPLEPVGRYLSTAAPGVADDDPPRWETVVGLELHVQLGTATKLFSAAPRRASSPISGSGSVSESDAVNVAVAAFDAAWPGALPSLNKRALTLAVRLGIALGGEVAKRTSFDRKHYHYADQPHGYQITQQREPVVTGGGIDVFVKNDTRSPENGSVTNGSVDVEEPNDSSRRSNVRLRVERLQLETDTGKSATRFFPDAKLASKTKKKSGTREWLVDYNRAGCALVEIVTLPDLRSAEEAVAAVEAFQRAVRFLEVGDANMEDGSLRADVNVSVRRVSRFSKTAENEEVFGERCEIKNLNSTRSVLRAVRHEAARQIAILENGGVVNRETRGFDAETGTTIALRGKEVVADYRFAPEPDVPTTYFTDADIAEMARGVPELPDAAKQRLVDPEGEHRLKAAVADTLVSHPTTLDAYERALAAARATLASEKSSEKRANAESDLARTVAHWVVGELVGAAKRAKVVRRANAPLAHLPGGATPEAIGELLGLAAAGKCTARMAKAATAAMLVAEPSVDHSGSRRSWPTARQTLVSLFGSETEREEGKGDFPTEEETKNGGDEGNERALRLLCVAVVAEKPMEAALFRGGKTRLMGAFVGEIMRRTKGRADPRRAAEMVKEALLAESSETRAKRESDE